jgi:bifunctional ADP-heptose synthase (sugar kinase/adenylyltransferase)
LGVKGESSPLRVTDPAAPLLPDAERAELVAAFRAVDHAVIFEEDTADRLVALLRPAVHAKGTDYTVDSVPERATVVAAGGRVAIAGDAKAHSSRDVIAEILARFGPGRPDRRMAR